MNIFIRIKTRTLQHPAAFAAAALCLLLSSAVSAGCAPAARRAEKKQEVEYSIVESGELPEKLLEAVERKKEAEFKITFEADDALYIVHGYGEQETGGYSVAVHGLYLTEKALYFDTELIGPQNGSNPQKKPSYPYIVVKTKKYKQNVVFE